MNIEELYETGERKGDRSHFRNLVRIAKAEQGIGAEEKNMLLKIGSHIGLSAEQIDGIIKDKNQYSIVVPANREERFEQIVHFIQMAHVDGKIGDKEMGLIEKLAVGIGYRSIDDVDVESILALINRGEGVDTIMDELLY